MRNEIIIFSIFLAILLYPVVLAGPGEAYGNVTHVVDGDTIYVQIQGYDSRIGNISVRLADIDCPEMNTDGGLAAKQYAFQELYGSLVSLDLDDLTGKDKYCRWVAVVFLQKQNGTLANFNRMLVDSGHACIWNFTNNEFDPANWWNGTYPLAAGKKGFFCSSTKKETGSVTNAGGGNESCSCFDVPLIGNAASRKYHCPCCQSVKQMNPANEVLFASASKRKAMGMCHAKRAGLYRIFNQEFQHQA